MAIRRRFPRRSERSSMAASGVVAMTRTGQCQVVGIHRTHAINGSGGADASVAHFDLARQLSGNLHVVGDHQQRGAIRRSDFAQQIEYSCAGSRIQRASRFISK